MLLSTRIADKWDRVHNWRRWPIALWPDYETTRDLAITIAKRFDTITRELVYEKKHAWIYNDVPRYCTECLDIR